MPFGLEELIAEYGLLPLLTLAAAPVIAMLIARAVFGRNASPLAVTSVRRTKVLLCGPCGAGKTTIWQKLVHGSAKPTHTSMTANVGTAKAADGSSVELVDYPGHPRLREDVLPLLPSAKAIVIVLDAVAALDEAVGVHAVATLLAKLIEEPKAQGAAIVVAANKRDDPTSFSSKAVKKKLEAELTTLFAARSSAVGSANVAQVAAKGGAKPAAAKRRETGLMLEDGEKFTFEGSCSVPVEFTDIAAVADDTFNLDPIVSVLSS